MESASLSKQKGYQVILVYICGSQLKIHFEWSPQQLVSKDLSAH